jgi:hypothetical protein
MRSISLCHSDHGRTRAQRRAILATARLQRGEVDAASAVGALIVAAAWRLHSNHVDQEVASLAAALDQSGTVAARDFVEQARELRAARLAS